MSSLFIACLAAYFIGSIPTALIAGYLLGGVDIRTTGSKNAGATNLYRSFGLKPYLVVLGLDIFKGYAATIFLAPLASDSGMSLLHIEMLCGLMAVFGHVFTIFAGFRGGKGVATAAGMVLGIMPTQFLAALAVYILVTSITHYVSLGSISAAISLPAICSIEDFLLDKTITPEIYMLSAVISILIIVTHRANIKRLLRGEENKTYFFGK